MKNIFIEGLQGSGKSTLVSKLEEKLTPYKVYREGDISPVELAWCSYVTTEQYDCIMRKYPQLQEELLKHTRSEGDKKIIAYTRVNSDIPEFYQYMEGFEIYNGRVDFATFQDIILSRYHAFNTTGNIFECSLFQNSIESMMLYYQMEDDDILNFYKEVYEIMKNKNIILLYLDSHSMIDDILHIKKERSNEQGEELWFPLMMDYLKKSPYGTAHNYCEFEDLIHHMKRRRELEHRIIREVMGEHVILLKAKNYELDAVIESLSFVNSIE